MQHPKTFVLTHDLRDGSLKQSEPIIMRWNGVDMPKVLRTVRPGQYVLIPYEPSGDVLRPTREAA